MPDSPEPVAIASAANARVEGVHIMISATMRGTTPDVSSWRSQQLMVQFDALTCSAYIEVCVRCMEAHAAHAHQGWRITNMHNDLHGLVT